MPVHSTNGATKQGEADARPPRAAIAVAAFVSSAVLLGVWLALAGTADTQDIVAASAAALLASGVGAVVSRGGRALPSFRRGDLSRFALLVPQLVVETVEIYVATAKRVRGRGDASGFRTIDTDAAGMDWRGARRSGVLGALLSATPRKVLIELEPDTGSAIVHDFVLREGEQST